MDIKGLYSTALSSSVKTNDKTINAYSVLSNNSFNDLLTNVSQTNQTNQTNAQSDNQQSSNNLNSDGTVSNQASENAQNYQYDNSSNKNNSSDTTTANIDSSVNNNENATPVTNQVKDSLKEAGVSESDLNNIKTLKDLKEYLSKKVFNGVSKDSLNLSSLLGIISALMNGSVSKNDILNLKNKLSSDIETALNNTLKSIPGGKITSENLSQTMSSFTAAAKGSIKTDIQNILGKLNNSNISNNLVNKLVDKIKEQVVSDVSTNIKGTVNADVLSKVKQELTTVLNDSFNNLKLNKNQKNSSNSINSSKYIAENLDNNLSETSTTDKKGSQDSQSSLMSDNKKSNTADSFLKNLVSDNSNNKISQVTNFMSQFNNVKLGNTGVSSIENMVIDKNNITTDMIKAFKYMQTNNMKDLTVKINPKELGEVVIKLTMEDGNMKATINASTKEAYDLLNSNLADMTSKLQNNDVKIQSLSLNIYNDDTTFFKDGSRNQDNNGGQKGKKSRSISGVSEENEDLNTLSELDSNVNILA